MKAYKVTLLVIDFEQMSEQQVIDMIICARYPNRCISPSVQSIESRDIGEWSDDHLLNRKSTAEAEFERLFSSKDQP